MKKILVASFLVAALGASSSALAQAAGPGGVGIPPQSTAGKHEGGHDRKAMEKVNQEILAKLNLTEEQKAKLKAHQDEMKAKMLELRKGAKGAKGAGKSEEVKEKMKAMRKENQAFMKQTLTKDQLKEMMKLRREAMKDAVDKKAPAKP